MADSNKREGYEHSVDSNGVTRYKNNGKFIKTAEVPEEVSASLANLEPGTLVTEKGEVVPTSSEAEQAKTAEQQADGQDPGDAANQPGVEGGDILAGDAPRREDEKPENTDPEKPSAPQVAPEAPADDEDDADDVDDESGIDEEETRRAQAAQVDEEGMGFKRVKGKTVDIFDGKTPHTHVRNVGGRMVPLSEANYLSKTDTEIMKQLEKLDSKK